MRIRSAVSMLVTSFLFTAVAYQVTFAQEIKVLEQQGKDMTATAGKPTIIVFKCQEGTSVAVSELLSTSSSFAAASNGVTASGFGVSTKYLCTAPAKIEVPGGVYQFHIGGSALLGSAFRVDAQGGTQTWDLKNPSPAKYAVGFISTVFGLSATIVCGVIFAVGHTEYNGDDDYEGHTVHDGGMLAGAGAGVVAGIVGISLLKSSLAKAKLISIEF
ncbi:MAG: hypothetical protein ABSF80_10345 [Chitinispirillaceae bacterium]|jgi:hypothetical protein